ncbi:MULTISPECIES: YiiX/YebB-like N1pC/P60 family cysteine hydrolase [Aeribacillus]|uniref:YiiX/YebB-like N1pC/P60 family cysteine hydrolase n=1 Tax=Aeribacillus TaxID=1055323 RepID=UPI0007B4E3BC|nr:MULTISPECIES: YiiX/YebB-like N1pC/P60 family cysteine hydrolase [Aeribacillus]KZM56636.1 hypothetical protein A3Q35_07835 [Aeribacillus pallidus]MED0651535.1 YiiX/YebB-like N1pC/P60 family cysteine hydrolase [Aeribacillus composti]MED4487977.1 YiiX/YebB-like N1pC/P60 family cysteine hydrolase [Aeribacillus pallidus]
MSTVLSLCMLSVILPAVSHANSTSSEDIVQQQLETFERVEKEIESDPELVQPDKNSSSYNFKANNFQALAAPSYPKRKGVILVTKDGKFGSLVGHAGIIYSQTKTVESFPEKGVKTYDNDWNKKYKTVYAVTTKGTTVAQDAKAADRAYSHKGKPYNWEFTNINTTKKFYCSQLVYEAYKYSTGLNLNHGGGIVFPIDLVNSSHTYIIYTKGV